MLVLVLVPLLWHAVMDAGVVSGPKPDAGFMDILWEVCGGLAVKPPALALDMCAGAAALARRYEPA